MRATAELASEWLPGWHWRLRVFSYLSVNIGFVGGVLV